VEQYRAAGTQLIWVISPELRKVAVYLPNNRVQEVDAEGILEGGDILPGLQIPVAALFPE